MKQIGIIKKIVPLKERQTMGDNGGGSIFAVLGIVVTLGTQSCYIEFYQDLARKAAKILAEQQVCTFDFEMFEKEYTDKNGTERHETRLVGRDYQILSDGCF